MDEENLKRTLKALNTVSIGATAAHRALEQIVFALVATHPNKKELLTVVTCLIESDAGKNIAKLDENLISAYDFHCKRLLGELRPICENG